MSNLSEAEYTKLFNIHTPQQVDKSVVSLSQNNEDTDSSTNCIKIFVKHFAGKI
jgi:hypothetical protein